MAMTHDVIGFAERELKDREELGYPPYSRIALVRVDAVDERVARSEADRLAGVARQASLAGPPEGGRAEIVGPAVAPLARLRNRHRYRFLVRAAGRRELRVALAAVHAAATNWRTRVVIDVDPVSML
jgi:primosomal protein N' (replication factor Y)